MRYRSNERRPDVVLSPAAEMLIERLAGEDVIRALYNGMARLAPEKGRRVVNLADPKVMCQLRHEPSLLAHQTSDRQIEWAVRELINRGHISVEGWNGRGQMPSLDGPKSFRVLLIQN